MTVVAIPRTPKHIPVRARRRGKISKADALREIMALIDQRAPTDDQGHPTRWLTPQEYDSLLNDIYTLAADALGFPLE